MTPREPRTVLAAAPMGGRQIAVIALCVALNALDGFDVLSISFASPGIAHEWGIGRAALGIVLSMELIGMSAGSLLLGGLADRRGRRFTTLLCLAVMAAGMASATMVRDLTTLTLVRLVTGFGIGGMLAATNAVVAETASAARRDLCVALMAGGYPVGAIIGGAISTHLLAAGADWRAVFGVGAAGAVCLLPLVWAALPETVAFLVDRRPPDALARANETLRRFGHAPAEVLPDFGGGAETARWRALFAPPLLGVTLLLTIAYLAHIMTFYFILKWIPKLVVDMGFAPAAAGGVLVWANVGGALGALALSLASRARDVRPLVVVAMLASFVMVVAFGHGQADLGGLGWISAIAGFCTNAAVVGLYAIMARAFPTALRASGTGLVIGVGRGGSALAPMIAGFLFEAGVGLQIVAVVMAAGSLVGAAALVLLGRRPAISPELRPR